MRLVSLAVPVPSLDLLTYRVPDDLPMPAAGARVLAPLGQRIMTGLVVRGQPPTKDALNIQGLTPVKDALKDIIDILDPDPLLPPAIVELALWVAEYYMCGPGEAIATAMPPRAWIASERHARITDVGLTALSHARGARKTILAALAHGRASAVDALAGAIAKEKAKGGMTARDVERARRGLHASLAALKRDGLVTLTMPLRGTVTAFKTIQVARLTAQGHEDVPLKARQREALELLRGKPEGVPLRVLGARGIASATVKRLAARGLLTIVRERVERDPFARGAADWPADDVAAAVDLMSEQATALRRLSERAATRNFHAALLHGVTGSGKTEVYLRLARNVQEMGRRVLMLVPEIGLTPAAARIFHATFGGRVAVQHSGLSDGERHDQWQRIRRGDVDVVIGTRSAVFAPLASIGLIIVDEEHDTSYKQEESPRYHGRDVAVMRAKREGALVVLGSATPAMETYQNALAGRYEHISIERRVLDRPLAHVTVVDMREEYAATGPDVVLSRALADALRERLARAEQSLVLLNRRGFATAVFCRQCAATLECPNCSVSLTVHRAARRARCHYCNYSMGVPRACLKCAAPYLEQIGFGTERVAAEIATLFPQSRVERLDRDTVRRRGAAPALLGRFAAGDIDILVGTQMIAKGHDFPHVTLVGVVSADVGLGLADFRAAERTFQLLTQVAGRAGRGEIQGEALVQTIYPDHYSIRHACRQDYAGFFEDEIRYRTALRYPPVVALINIVVRARSLDAAVGHAGDLAIVLRKSSDEFRVLGPAPAPLGKLRGEHRAQLFLKGTNRAIMRAALTKALAPYPQLRRRITIDVDPVGVL